MPNNKKRRSEGRRRKRSKKNLYALLAIVLILICGYLYVADMDENNMHSGQNEVINKDGYYYSENPDSTRFLAKIVIDRNFNIIDLSKIFYKSEIFWPYIFEVNPRLPNPLNIEKGTVVFIPKVQPSLLDPNDEENKMKVKQLGDSILNIITERQKKEAALSTYK